MMYVMTDGWQTDWFTLLCCFPPTIERWFLIVQSFNLVTEKRIYNFGEIWYGYRDKPIQTGDDQIVW